MCLAIILCENKVVGVLIEEVWQSQMGIYWGKLIWGHISPDICEHMTAMTNEEQLTKEIVHVNKTLTCN